MGKYRFFGNILTKRGELIHPSIDLGIKNGKWENIEITSSPIKGNKYTEFDENPNLNWRKKNKDGTPIKRSFFRRYVRKDPTYAKLSEYKNYSLVKSDEEKIDKFLADRQKNILIDRQRRMEAVKKRQEKNDAKLRYHQGGRPANRHKSAHASSKVIKPKIYKYVNKKWRIK